MGVEDFFVGEGGGGSKRDGVRLVGAPEALPGREAPDAALDMVVPFPSVEAAAAVAAPLPSDVPEPSAKSTLPSTLAIGARLAGFRAGEGDCANRRSISATSSLSCSRVALLVAIGDPGTVSIPLPSAVVVSTPLVERFASAIAASILDIETELGVRRILFFFAPSAAPPTKDEDTTDDDDFIDPEGRFPVFGLPLKARRDANASAACCSLDAIAYASFALELADFFVADFLRGLAFSVALCNFWADVRDFEAELCVL